MLKQIIPLSFLLFYISVTHAQDEWTPESYDFVDPAAQLQSMLDQGKRYLNSGILVGKGSNNALATYFAILQDNPGNKTAISQITKIAELLFTKIDESFSANKIGEATNYINYLKQIKSKGKQSGSLIKKIDQYIQMSDWVVAAEKSFTESKWISPEKDNAYYYYQQIMSLDENSAYALAGLEKVLEGLLKNINDLLLEKDFNQAMELLTNIETFYPQSDKLDAIKLQLIEQDAEFKSKVINDIKIALDANDLVTAEAMLKKVESFTNDDEQVSSLRKRYYAKLVTADYTFGQIIEYDNQEISNMPSLVFIGEGNFVMGSTPREVGHKSNESPTRTVTVNTPFSISLTEITVAQFGEFVADTRYVTDAERKKSSSIFDERLGKIISRKKINWRHNYNGDKAQENYPVVHVSWNDAKAYTNWLSEKTGAIYRLPSEAEFEYALRAGSKGLYWWGNGNPPELAENTTGGLDRSNQGDGWDDAFLNYGDGYWGLAPVASFAKNGFGLYDMAGNASEWVEDCWFPDHNGAPEDASYRVNTDCERRVIKGGSWASFPQRARSANRLSAKTSTTSAQVGFRVVKEF